MAGEMDPKTHESEQPWIPNVELESILQNLRIGLEARPKPFLH